MGDINNTCPLCGEETSGGISWAGAVWHRICATDVQLEVDKRRAENPDGTINAVKIAREMYHDKIQDNPQRG